MADGCGFDLPYAAADAGSGPVELVSREDAGFSGFNLLDGWQTTDWLELDSSAFEGGAVDVAVAGTFDLARPGLSGAESHGGDLCARVQGKMRDERYFE
ncbi:hypothetical protein LY78DRAFT_683403 [Colletotrichum sublineola]|nr:hypothetical protein LY78DRAFT_683403 [Colletotrichum sublineola]